jgi:hypothetical protein
MYKITSQTLKNYFSGKYPNLHLSKKGVIFEIQKTHCSYLLPKNNLEFTKRCPLA